MKKLALMMALAFSITSVHSFAGGKDKGMKNEKCSATKPCCKKMSKIAAMEKAKVADKKAA